MHNEFNPGDTFLQEAEELLAEIEQAALSLEPGEAARETVNLLFRAFHTIKGSGAMFGFDDAAAFTHHVETLLDKVREGEVAVTPKLVELVLSAKDHIRLLLGAKAGISSAKQEEGKALLAAIETLSQEPAPASAPATPEVAEWEIEFHPNANWLAFGGNPLALFGELAALGEATVTAHHEALPDLDSIEPDQCYLWWKIVLRGPTDENPIRDVFLFVLDDSRLEIRKVTGEAEVETAAPVEAAPAQEGASTAPRALGKESTVRVPAGRLDRLVNLVGELVMNQSRLAQAARLYGGPEFANPIQELQRLVSELRDNVLGIRMLPIGSLFGRFRRLVHDLSSELGKEVELVTEGAETELDKSILDELGEPMVHCLRNCLDHGVEAPEQREQLGKPKKGTIRLSAVHTGSNVVVSIQDDGRGIDRAAVLAKARERQLISSDAALSDRDIFNLILQPGFSTAEKITSVSGRGVGMDAVRRQIDALRGQLSISSTQGSGTCISITLPLTLAIIEGLLVQVGGDRFIVPLAAVTENVELLRAQRERNNGRNVITVRGELVPYVDLRRTFRLSTAAPPIEKVVIVQHDDARVGLVVDRVLGTHQTVIQSLGRHLRNVSVVSGATILGDGRVALILDVAAVVRHADHECRAALNASEFEETRPMAG